jgi:hypothetical protein
MDVHLDVRSRRVLGVGFVETLAALLRGLPQQLGRQSFR